MARSWEYSKRRRMAMQIVMIVILSATVALAGWVSKARSRKHAVELTHKVLSDDQAFDLPREWVVSRSGATTVVQEPGRGGRLLLIEKQQVTGNISSEDFLIGSHLLDGAMLESDDDDSDDEQMPTTAETVAGGKPITIAGSPGVMAAVQEMGVSQLGRGVVVRHKIVAGAVIGSSQAITIVLRDSSGGDVEENEELVRKVGGAIRLTTGPTVIH